MKFSTAGTLGALLVAGAVLWLLRQPSETAPAAGPAVLSAPEPVVLDRHAVGAAAREAEEVSRPPTALHLETLGPDGKPVPTIDLRGAIRDEFDVPLADVRIEALPGRDETEPGIDCSSGADGRFALPPFAQRRGEFRISKPGYLTISGSLPPARPDGKPTGIGVTLRHALTLHGVVRWTDGAPCSGASLEARAARPDAWGTYGAPSLGTADADEQGRFTMAQLATAQVVQLRVRAGSRSSHLPFTVELLAGPEQEVALELSRPATLRVVLDDLGTRTDIPAEALDRMHYALFTDGAYDLVGQAFGREEVPTFSGLDAEQAYVMVVNVDGFGGKWFNDPIVVRSGDNTWHGTLGDLPPELPLPPEDTRARWPFRWSLVDEQHQPISGAEANARWTAARWEGTPFLQARALETGEETTIALSWQQRDSYDDAGTCQVSIPAPIELSYTLGGTRQVVTPVASGQEVELVVPMPKDAALVTLSARGSRGQQVRMPDCFVQARGLEASIFLPAPARGAVTQVWLLPGDYTVCTVGGDYASGTTEVGIVDASPRTVELLLHRGGTLSGRLHLPETLTAEFVQLRIRNAAPGGLRQGVAVRTDGSFELLNIAPGDYVLSLEAEDAATGGSVAGSLPVVIAADRVTRLSVDGSVFADATAALSVRLQSADRATLSLASEDGAFSVTLHLERDKARVVRLPRGAFRYELVPSAAFDVEAAKGRGVPHASEAVEPTTGVLHLPAGPEAVTLEL